MPRPVTVWAVELGPGSAQEDVKGSLTLMEDALAFAPADPAEPPMAIALGSISKVRRLRGSPVLMVVHEAEGARRRTAFYFAPPPPLGVLLGTHEAPRPSGIAAFRNPKRRARKENVGYLGATNRDKKAVLTEWVRAVRSAAGAA